MPLPCFTLEQCPIQLGRVLRIVSEADEPYVVAASFCPLLQPVKYPGQINLFGSWLPGGQPVVDQPGAASARREPDANEIRVIVPLVNIVVWPFSPEPGSTHGHVEGLQIPLLVFHFLHTAHGIDVSIAQFAFARRGHVFKHEVSGRHAKRKHDNA